MRSPKWAAARACPNIAYTNLRDATVGWVALNVKFYRFFTNQIRLQIKEFCFSHVALSPIYERKVK